MKEEERERERECERENEGERERGEGEREGEAAVPPLSHGLSLRQRVGVAIDHHTVCVSIDDIQSQLKGKNTITFQS